LVLGIDVEKWIPTPDGGGGFLFFKRAIFVCEIACVLFQRLKKPILGGTDYFNFGTCQK
jgi:hypothetical protein